LNSFGDQQFNKTETFLRLGKETEYLPIFPTVCLLSNFSQAKVNIQVLQKEMVF
jgi:hypothetical protein